MHALQSRPRDRVELSESQDFCCSSSGQTLNLFRKVRRSTFTSLHDHVESD